MNTKSIYILIFLAMTTFMSCEEFLEEQGHSEYTGEVLSTTEQGMEALVNSCYTGLRFIHGNEDYILMTEVGTDTYTSAGHFVANPFNTYGPGLNGTTLENGYIWKYLYLALNTTNATLEFLPESPLTDLKKTIREGEIRFLRAHYLWNITEIYGPSHFSTTTVKDKQLTAYHTPVETFYDQIFEDLEFAEANLPDIAYDETDYGRATKWAARAALARMHLTRKNYQKAFEYADMVIKSPDFELVPSFADLWDIANDEYNENNHEIIWSVQFAHQDEASSYGIDSENSNDELPWPQRKGNGMHLYYLPYYQQETFKGINPVVRDLENGRAFVRFEPTLFLLDLYDETMDDRYWIQFKHVFYCNNSPEGYELEIGDTAMWYTKDVAPDWMKDPATAPYLVFDRNSMYDENGLPVGDRRVMYGLNKFLDPTRLDKEIENSGRDVFIFRLAEMYFIAAEAQHYLGNNNLAADYLNVVRRRAAMPGKETDMEITAADVNIDFILDEKGREFAGEYIRWFDLKRTNKLVERVRLHNPDCSANIQDHHMLRPIPQTQLNSITNSDEFKQNPGYN